MERLYNELDIIASHLDIEAYYNLRYAIANSLPAEPHLSLYMYRLETTSCKGPISDAHYPVKLDSRYFCDEAFEFAERISDTETVSRILATHNVSKFMLEKVFQKSSGQFYKSPKIGWLISKYMLEYYKIPIDAKYSSLLYFQAATFGYLQIVRELVDLPTVETVYSHSRVFVQACLNNRTDVACFLLEKPLVDINFRAVSGSRGYSGLMKAIGHGNLTLVCKLLSFPHLVIQMRDLSEGLSTWKYKTDKTELMKVFHVLLNDKRLMWNELDNRPLKEICAAGMEEAAKLLLLLPGISLDNDVIFAAAFYKQYQLVNTLLADFDINPFPEILVYPCRSKSLAEFQSLMKHQHAKIDLHVLRKAIYFRSHGIINCMIKDNYLDLSDHTVHNIVAGYAVKHEKVEMLKRLAQIRKFEYTSRLSNNIYLACRKGSMAGIFYLLDTLVNSHGDEKCWSISSILQAKHNNWGLVDRLLDHPWFNPSHKRNILLKLACKFENFEIVQKITRHPRFQMKKREYPIDFLIQTSNIHITDYMIRHTEFDPATMRNYLFRKAAKYSCKEYIEYLLTVDEINPLDLIHKTVPTILERHESFCTILNHPKFEQATPFTNPINTRYRPDV
ncbi:hypothetical protein HK103_006540 [Boothiomyces macroporosus]|uniref:Ankyrin repeat protein n=1 Tax=Boothiomyces macroporosus TaxID=261099 RepID=A0AAD5Y6M0_9FUNG|nr:hypothetical protein HK103_006540 [Boothiomyces macroporosus]